MKYPPYACQCCGFANGDMFVDYFRHIGREPTEAEKAYFEAYLQSRLEIQELNKRIADLQQENDILRNRKRRSRPVKGKTVSNDK